MFTRQSIALTPKLYFDDSTVDDLTLRAHAKKQKAEKQRAMKLKHRKNVLDGLIKGKISERRSKVTYIARNLLKPNNSSSERRFKIANQPLIIEDFDDDLDHE